MWLSIVASGMAIRIGYEVCDWQVEFLKHSSKWASKSSRAWYGAVWLTVGIPVVCCYAGLAESGMKLCGWYVEIFAALSYFGHQA